MRLFELFDKVYDYRLSDQNSSTLWGVTFKTDKRIIYMARADKYGDTWDAGFIPISKNSDSIIKDNKDKDSYAVMGTITEILKEFIKQVKPEKISIIGSSASRNKLYKRLLERNNSCGYNLEILGDNFEDMAFKLTRK